MAQAETISQWIRQAEQAGNDDLVSKELRQRDYALHLLYLSSICDTAMIRKDLIHPFAAKSERGEFILYLQALPETAVYDAETDAGQLISLLYEGHALVMDGETVWSIDVRKFQSGSIGDAKVETVILGPQDAFTGDMDTNLNMLRSRYAKETLRIRLRRADNTVKNRIALLYDDSLADPDVLNKVEERLDRIQSGVIQSVGHLERLIYGKTPWSPFPKMMISERPDRTVRNIAEGKIVLLVEGDNFALIAPTIFLDFFHSMDDISLRKPVAYFLSVIRGLALLTALTLPAFYVAVSSFNPELFRIQLALVVAGTRASVPYPPFLEVLFMLLMMELLSEASVRLPKSIGPAATTVGGLILGQAATTAGLVGDIMIIIVAAVAISNFVIPIVSMSFAVRFLKYPLIVMAGLFGLYGMLVGILGLLLYLADQTSFGQPYFQIFRTKERKGKPTG